MNLKDCSIKFYIDLYIIDIFLEKFDIEYFDSNFKSYSSP